MSSTRRNYLLPGEKHDVFFEWLKELLNHSFVLNLQNSYGETFDFVENLINEHRANPTGSKLSLLMPFISSFHTPLPLRIAYEEYDKKYYITKRRFVKPSFNELRHIFNLAQVMAIGKNLSFICFDGDQTLYQDGGNFEENSSLSGALRDLLISGVRVAIVTAAGYGLDSSKYEVRIGTLLKFLHESGLTKEQLERFYVCGGECNYLLQCSLVTINDQEYARLVPMDPAVWQAPHLIGPKPSLWSQDEVKRLLDVGETIMKESIQELHLRVNFIRKERAIGMYPGGDAKCVEVPIGHGSRKIKKEALDEIVFRLKEGLKGVSPPLTLPYCVFNGGRDVWVDIGNKSIGVAALQAYFGIKPEQCLFVGDQFLNTGNDIAARDVSPCIWINSPAETGKVLQHVLKYAGVQSTHSTKAASSSGAGDKAPVFDVFTGLKK